MPRWETLLLLQTLLHVIVTSHSFAAMPKKSSKSKSKRTTLKQKYKVIKKVKEHGRKLRKEARKSGKKHKAPADPGLPKQWPFKQELIAELDEKRRLILEAEAAKKAERKAARVHIACPSNPAPVTTELACVRLVHAKAYGTCRKGPLGKPFAADRDTLL